jgi:hypothetical protein
LPRTGDWRGEEMQVAVVLCAERHGYDLPSGDGRLEGTGIRADHFGVAQGLEKIVALGFPRATPGREAFVRPANGRGRSVRGRPPGDVDECDAIGKGCQNERGARTGEGRNAARGMLEQSAVVRHR